MFSLHHIVSVIPRNIQDSVFIFNLQLDKMLKLARCFSTFSHLYNNNIPKVNTAILNFSLKKFKSFIINRIIIYFLFLGSRKKPALQEGN